MHFLPGERLDWTNVPHAGYVPHVNILVSRQSSLTKIHTSFGKHLISLHVRPYSEKNENSK